MRATVACGEMGSSQSKGGLRQRVRPLVPRSWAELEQLHLRFQQETHRRQSEREAQYFLSFPVFRAIVAPLCPTLDKTQLLAIFTALDHKQRSKIAAIDFFCGLALVVDAKKAQKLECSSCYGCFGHERQAVRLSLTHHSARSFDGLAGQWRVQDAESM